MAADLHFAVCATYRQAIAERRAEREAFDMATRVVCERHPGVPSVEARRRVAEMLCRDPPAYGLLGELNSLAWSFQSERQIVRQIQPPPKCAAVSDR